MPTRISCRPYQSPEQAKSCTAQSRCQWKLLKVSIADSARSVGESHFIYSFLRLLIQIQGELNSIPSQHNGSSVYYSNSSTTTQCSRLLAPHFRMRIYQRGRSYPDVGLLLSNFLPSAVLVSHSRKLPFIETLSDLRSKDKPLTWHPTRKAVSC